MSSETFFTFALSAFIPALIPTRAYKTLIIPASNLSPTGGGKEMEEKNRFADIRSRKAALGEIGNWPGNNIRHSASVASVYYIPSEIAIASGRSPFRALSGNARGARSIVRINLPRRRPPPSPSRARDSTYVIEWMIACKQPDILRGYFPEPPRIRPQESYYALQFSREKFRLVSCNFKFHASPGALVPMRRIINHDGLRMCAHFVA